MVSGCDVKVSGDRECLGMLSGWDVKEWCLDVSCGGVLFRCGVWVCPSGV